MLPLPLCPIINSHVFQIEKVRLGRYENRNPFFVVALPKFLRETAVQKQLQEKSLQLMTHFDLHGTFMDILHVSSPFSILFSQSATAQLQLSNFSSNPSQISRTPLTVICCRTAKDYLC